MSFGLERQSGAKCFMLSARALSIVWGDDPACWIWTASFPGSRFPEVAELVDVCWLEITGKLNLSLLSAGTTYAAYLVYTIAADSYGLECNVGILPPKAMVTVVSGTKPPPAATTTSTEHTICLQHMHGEEETVMHRRKQQYMRLRKGYSRKLLVTREADPDIRCPRRRADGWAEVELGEFAVAGDEDGVVEVSLKEIDNQRWKRGLIVQGIEIRPKHTS
uniref:F-box domain-containing protein n=1 Tax=Arundo donax TaxID=35708 RepID=A0A0A8ZWW5_ARUDO